MIVRKKLIEVDLPLDEINAESKREKSIRHGHPSTLHLWWARRPLAACRAVIFASMVDDPSSCPDEFPTEQEQLSERTRLHNIIRQVVKWESTDEKIPASREVQNEARYEIARSVARSRGETPPDKDRPTDVLRYLNENAPPIYDPFAGGGSIPLEAQRLGLSAIASDLNPVAVLINKALIELPPKFAGRPPVNPDAAGTKDGSTWHGTAGLADDIRYYGKWMRDEAESRIGHLYPKVRLPDEEEATVIAWLWARTVPCPNPACGITMPLMVNFQLSKKPNNQHWTRPVVDRQAKVICFVVQNHEDGVPKEGTVNRNGATCIACNTTSPLAYVRQQSRAGKMGEQMTAIVAEGHRKRLFLTPTVEHVKTALGAVPNPIFIPQQKMPTTAYKISGRGYGITHWHQLFTNRQLTALTTLSDLMSEARALIVEHGADEEYADTVCTYLSLAVGREVDMCSSFDRWHNTGEKITGVFGRQAIPMIWDFAESNPLSNSTGNWMAHIEWIAKVVDRLPITVNRANAHQEDASTMRRLDSNHIIITDPPYYDNISYAELSDYFYIWLRPLLCKIYTELFAGILVPIEDEMVAAPRFEKSRERFEKLLSQTLRLIRERSSSGFPSCIFYAYKQQEENRQGSSSTGWDTMLTALVSAGFQIVGTWPMRTEMSAEAKVVKNANYLASSIVLVCRIRLHESFVATRREFIDALRYELPTALHQMQTGNIAPVDLAQAAIGPGMAVFTRYGRVLDASGEVVSVREALALINQTLDEVLAEQDGSFDAETCWALAWFEQSGFTEGEFGVAETLSKAKNTSVTGMVGAGMLESGAGKVRLLRPDELKEDWDPQDERKFTIWEATHHLVRVLDQGEPVAAEMMAKLGANVEPSRELAYRLYRICDRKKRSQEALGYNSLIQSWPEITRLARDVGRSSWQTSFTSDVGTAQ